MAEKLKKPQQECLIHAITYITYDNAADVAQEEHSKRYHECVLHSGKKYGVYCDAVPQLRTEWKRCEGLANKAFEDFAYCILKRRNGKKKGTDSNGQ